MDKYYTTRGDDGTTGILGESRVKKYHPRPATYGDVDETQAALGIARATMQDDEVKAVILRCQHDLYHLMAELAATVEAAPQFRKIDAGHVQWLEEQTDRFGERIKLPKAFTISGDSVPSAHLDLARTITRRAERSIVRLYDDELLENPHLMAYMNRLSSLLYVLSRYEDALSGQSEVKISGKW